MDMSRFPKTLDAMTGSERLEWAATRLEAFEALAQPNRKGELVGELEGKPFRFDLNVVLDKLVDPAEVEPCGFAGCAIGWLTATPELLAACPKLCAVAVQPAHTEYTWQAFLELCLFIHGAENSRQFLNGHMYEAQPFMPNFYRDQITEDQWTTLIENSEGTLPEDTDYIDPDQFAHLISPSMVAKELRDRAARARKREAANEALSSIVEICF